MKLNSESQISNQVKRLKSTVKTLDLSQTNSGIKTAKIPKMTEFQIEEAERKINSSIIKNQKKETLNKQKLPFLDSRMQDTSMVDMTKLNFSYDQIKDMTQNDFELLLRTETSDSWTKSLETKTQTKPNKVPDVLSEEYNFFVQNIYKDKPKVNKTDFLNRETDKVNLSVNELKKIYNNIKDNHALSRSTVTEPTQNPTIKKYNMFHRKQCHLDKIQKFV